MRIISGKYKGKNLVGFDIDGTRPTMDRVKESIFGTIQNYISGSTVLDLFAGSASLGLEAISNGAKTLYLVDNNKEIINIINKNIKNMNDDIKVIKNDYKNALENFKNIKFDLVFLDPPYKLNLINDSINRLIKYDLLNDNALIICEYENEVFSFDNLEIIKEKKYGTKNVRIYQYKK